MRFAEICKDWRTLHCDITNVKKLDLSDGDLWKQQKASEQNAAAGGSSQQPSTLVDLFVSVEKIMVLNTDLQVEWPE